jgi:hypothetical protein
MRKRKPLTIKTSVHKCSASQLRRLDLRVACRRLPTARSSGVFLPFGFMFPNLPRGASLYRFDDSASQRFWFVVGVK